jgi:deoxyribonucleoside regulator
MSICYLKPTAFDFIILCKNYNKCYVKYARTVNVTIKLTNVMALQPEHDLYEIAVKHYRDKKTLETIGNELGLTRQAISQKLKKAEEEGIVTIDLHEPTKLRSINLKTLSYEAKNQLGLDEVLLVLGENTDNSVQFPDRVSRTVLARIAQEAANHLDSVIQYQCKQKSESVLALTGGCEIMRRVVHRLSPKKEYKKLKVVPTMGFIQPEANFGDPNLVANDLANAYGAKHYWLPIPAVVEDKQLRNQMQKHRLVEETLKLADSADVIIMGLWVPDEDGLNRLFKRNVIDDKQYKVLCDGKSKPKANINLWFFDGNGNSIVAELEKCNFYLTGLDIPKLRERVVERSVKSILVAGGGEKYTDAIKAVLKAGIITELITDHVTALRLVEKEL